MVSEELKQWLERDRLEQARLRDLSDKPEMHVPSAVLSGLFYYDLDTLTWHPKNKAAPAGGREGTG